MKDELRKEVAKTMCTVCEMSSYDEEGKIYCIVHDELCDTVLYKADDVIEIIKKRLCL